LPLFGREESQRVENWRALCVTVGNKENYRLATDDLDNGPNSGLTFRRLEDTCLHKITFLALSRFSFAGSPP